MKKLSIVKRDDLEQRLHLANLYPYISAYPYSKEEGQRLIDDIYNAVIKAKETMSSQILDYDGEMFLLITAGGYISLCLRWKMYKYEDASS